VRLNARQLTDSFEASWSWGRVMLTAAECRARSAECRQMAEHAPNLRVQDILLDMARTWTRLAFEAEQWSQSSRPRLQLNKNRRMSVPSPLLPIQRSSQVDRVGGKEEE
jgi:hypothetical protein